MSSKVKAAAKKIPDWALADDGREDEPHVTVKYGLHSNDPDAVRKVVASHAPFKISLGRTSVFPDSGHGDVIKAEVKGAGLRELNKKIAAAAKHTDSHPDYHPHVTLAYVKRGLGKTFAGDRDLEGESAIVDHIIFSTKDGRKSKLPLNIGRADVMRRLANA